MNAALKPAPSGEALAAEAAAKVLDATERALARPAQSDSASGTLSDLAVAVLGGWNITIMPRGGGAGVSVYASLGALRISTSDHFPERALAVTAAQAVRLLEAERARLVAADHAHDVAREDSEGWS